VAETTPPALWPSREDRQTGMARLGDLHGARQVGNIVGDILDVEALALRLAAAAQIEREYRMALLHQFAGGPEILAAMGVHAVADHDDGARCAVGLPRAQVDLEVALAVECLFGCDRHRVSPRRCWPERLVLHAE
jgi:hypothetical protein